MSLTGKWQHFLEVQLLSGHDKPSWLPTMFGTKRDSSELLPGAASVQWGCSGGLLSVPFLLPLLLSIISPLSHPSLLLTDLVEQSGARTCCLLNILFNVSCLEQWFLNFVLFFLKAWESFLQGKYLMEVQHVIYKIQPTLKSQRDRMDLLKLDIPLSPWLTGPQGQMFQICWLGALWEPLKMLWNISKFCFKSRL